MSHRFGSSAASIAPLLFALAGLGGATLPWTVGFVSTRSGSLRSGLVVPLAGILLMFLLHVAQAAWSQGSSAEARTRALAEG